MKHRIKPKDLSDFNFEHEIVRSSAGCDNKSIKVAVDTTSNVVSYKVYQDKELKKTTRFLESAVEIYNEL